jgi:hypothetical protein
MLIRYGYEITITCEKPTALVCLLSVHEDRAADIRVPETTFTQPSALVTTYRWRASTPSPTCPMNA